MTTGDLKDVPETVCWRKATLLPGLKDGMPAGPVNEEPSVVDYKGH
ncbi:MAG: hypothetical protein HY673_18255 [Chloroflexi bacterium]|nr:hypothetical protein [Chloroflexota bacterium]